MQAFYTDLGAEQAARQKVADLEQANNDAFPEIDRAEYRFDMAYRQWKKQGGSYGEVNNAMDQVQDARDSG